MDLQKCAKCYSGFRTSKASETLCASCEVKFCSQPTMEIEQEFADYQNEIYGNDGLKEDVKDVFNHKARLQSLLDKTNTGNTNNKERVRQKREINRLQEEAEAVQTRYDELQREMFKKMFFMDPRVASNLKSMSNSRTDSVYATTNCPDPVSTTPPSKTSPLKKKQAPSIPTSPPSAPNELKHATPAPSTQVSATSPTKASVRTTPPTQASVRTTPPTQASVSTAFPPTKAHDFQKVSSPPIGSLINQCKSAPTTPTQGFKDKDTPFSTPTASMDTNNNQDELCDLVSFGKTHTQGDQVDGTGPRGINATVKNRIKEFEELNRRASTGSWDRKPLNKKKLQF